jgi:endogenous inhibitor of DNA gyrase (YacG/DUF329 family)
MARYWTPKKQKSVISERCEQLDLLFEFANAELMQKKNGNLKLQIQDFLNIIMIGHPGSYPNILSSKNDDLIKGLQKHLRARLKKIIHNTKIIFSEMPLWKISGTIEFKVEAKTNRFHERFRFRKIKPENELKALKRIIDKAIIDITKDLDLKPIRFRQCPRCGNFFYQPTKKEKVYCSIRCGDAVRLQAFRKEKKKMQKQQSD